MERLERRAVGRVNLPSQAIIVVCDTKEVIPVRVRNIGPLGVGIILAPETKSVLGKDVILVAETQITYAHVVREQPLEDGSMVVGLAARRFPQNVLQFLFQSVEGNTDDASDADGDTIDPNIISSLRKGIAAYSESKNTVGSYTPKASSDPYRENAFLNIADATQAVVEAQQTIDACTKAVKQNAANAQEAFDQASLAVYEAEVALKTAQDSLAYLQRQTE